MINSDWVDKKLGLRVGHLRIMRFRLEAGVPVEEIAQDYHLNPGLVENIKRYRVWPGVKSAAQQ